MSRVAAQFVALAGALAEHGVSDLVFVPAVHKAGQTGAPRAMRLVPGQTDLPRILEDAPAGSRFLSDTLGLVVERGIDSLVVHVASTSAACEVASRLAM